MEVYLDLVILLNFLVDFFLLLATNRLCGYPSKISRMALAGFVGGIYGGVCLLPGFSSFLGNMFWRTLALCAIAVIAFGFYKETIRKTILFLLLSWAIGGITLGFEQGSIWSTIAAAGGVCIMCAVGFREKIGAIAYIPLELSYNGVKLNLVAMQDTGNTLRDPITGDYVIIIGADAAMELTGLTQEQLENPVAAMGMTAFSGLRLIPYRSVGQSRGMLLAMRIPHVRIGSWKGSRLVAFSPEKVGSKGTYQALTGGVI
jgi:stage II sporulation protein GA (sporulation sigma-E factor processing peptidase)